MEDYKEKYEQALERAKICYKDLSNLDGVVATMSKDFFEEVFPELKESEDDRVRKSIIGFLKTIASLKDGKTVSNEDFDSEALLEWAAWLEKQGKKFQYWEPSEEQLGALDYAYNLCPDTERGNYYEGVLETLIDALHNLSEKQGEQKQHLELKAGHWYFCHQAYCERADILTVKEGETFKCEKDGIVKGLIIKEPEKYFREISTPTDKVEPKFKVGDCIINSEGMLRHILSVDKTGYQTDYGWLTHDIYDNTYHLWTIQDAKDGDVLYECNEKKPFIFKELKTKHIGDIASYCDIFNGIFNPNEDNWTTLDIVPATKGQRDILFHKMKKAGYEWDGEKKELRKIEQKPTDKVEPKFRVGDWVIYECGEYSATLQIENIVDKTYEFTDNSTLNVVDENMLRLWTIQDAKDGDVLVGNYDNCKKPWIGIFKCISKDRPTTQFDSYCFLNSSHHIFITPLSCDFYNQCKGHTIRYALPATKEQCDLLFSKMKEAGYEWDAEKKELKKIEQKPTDKVGPKFKVGDVIRLKGGAAEYTIRSVTSTTYYTDGWSYDIEGCEEDYELVEQKSTWSEEDEKMYQSIMDDTVQENQLNGKQTDWLRDIKYRHFSQPQNTWKPSDEQIEALLKLEEMHVLEHEKNQENAHLYMVIKSIREQLLKLKGE